MLLKEGCEMAGFSARVVIGEHRKGKFRSPFYVVGSKKVLDKVCLSRSHSPVSSDMQGRKKRNTKGIFIYSSVYLIVCAISSLMILQGFGHPGFATFLFAGDPSGKDSNPEYVPLALISVPIDFIASPIQLLLLYMLRGGGLWS